MVINEKKQKRISVMECAKQGYWAREHSSKKYGGKSASYEKRQFHKARRRHDDEIISSHLLDYRYPWRKTLSYDPLIYDNDVVQLHQWQEHNHKAQLEEVTQPAPKPDK